jgi:hypothetical protein
MPERCILVHIAYCRNIKDRQNDQVQEAADTQQPLSDEKVRAWLAKVCEKEIETFLQPCIAQLTRNSSILLSSRLRLSLADQKRRTKEQVVFFSA